MRLIIAKLVAAAVLIALSTTARAQDVTVAIGLTLPPYVISESRTGMEYDIVKEALAAKGHAMVPKFVPFARVFKDFDNREVEAAMTANPSLALENAFYSETVVTYRNVAVTLKRNGFRLDSLADLAGKEVLAFQNARSLLGPGFSEAVEKARYREIANQQKQVALLFLGRTEVFVGDVNIFKFYRKDNEDADTSAEVVVHELFPPTHYSVAFHDRKIRDDFNAGLARLRASGRYDEIIRSYIP